eukprot:TRINITY_DN44000_c0_g1_i1.p2 TRINITY_DN44000_c0_g1~~TRINITY_DN44000_c0_g1_i1.p2  ORF type:complete len:192 (+),score=46.11 TRINITY_DN44000_c0_g1_i1:90-665(+)
MPDQVTVVLAPGNGCDGTLEDCMWYPWIRDKLVEEFGERITFQLRAFPDPMVARESIWLPFMTELGAAGNIVIGHSSGAAAALRYAEQNKMAGIVLCSGYDSDLGDRNERMSGYFDREWDWDRIRSNCGFIDQFHSRNDMLVPFEVGKRVADAVSSNFTECYDGHFQSDVFPELLTCMRGRLSELLDGGEK